MSFHDAHEWQVGRHADKGNVERISSTDQSWHPLENHGKRLVREGKTLSDENLTEEAK